MDLESTLLSRPWLSGFAVLLPALGGAALLLAAGFGWAATAVTGLTGLVSSAIHMMRIVRVDARAREAAQRNAASRRRAEDVRGAQRAILAELRGQLQKVQSQTLQLRTLVEGAAGRLSTSFHELHALSEQQKDVVIRLMDDGSDGNGSNITVRQFVAETGNLVKHSWTALAPPAKRAWLWCTPWTMWAIA